MTQYPAFLRTYVPIAIAAVVGWLASLGINVSNEAQTALAVGIGGVVSAAWYALVRVVEKRWPWVGVLIGSAKTPDGYSKGQVDHATQAVPGDDTATVEPDTEGLEDDTDDDTADDADDSEDDATDDADDEITDDVDDEPETDTPVADTYTPRHSA